VPNPTPKANARLVVTEDVPTTDLALKGTANATELAAANATANGTKGSGAEDLVRGSMKGTVLMGCAIAVASFLL